MKNLKSLTIAIFLMLPVFILAQNTVLKPADYPIQITSVVQKYYPAEKIKNIKFTKEDGEAPEYEVKLSGRREISFDENFNLREIEDDNGIPTELLSQNNLNRVSQRFPGKKIVEWEIEDGQQKIEFEDGSEAAFDLKGYYLK